MPSASVMVRVTAAARTGVGAGVLHARRVVAALRRRRWRRPLNRGGGGR